MMILFAGGLAMGKLINGSGASTCLAEIVSKMSLDNSLIIIIFFVILARILSEVTNGTSSAAVCVPIIFEFTTKLGLNPIPYWFITTMAFNGEYLLPISVRAIPIAYGLDAEKMLKYGVPMTIINMVVVIIFGYLAINMWPTFSTLPYIGN
jgi:sodium-dependent dicarboxylate transporter 2/3/5